MSVLRKSLTRAQTYVLAGATGALLLPGAAAAQNQSNVTHPCDRACLTVFVDVWMQALIANDASALPMAADARVTLNGDETNPAGVFWDEAASVQARIDIANPRWGDTGTQAVVTNEDGSQYIYVFRLKVRDGAITESESMLIRNVEEGGLFDLSTLQTPNPNFNTPIRPAEQDSYYDLVAAAESYWRAFNTNGTPEYRPAEFWPNVPRLENGFKTTDVGAQGNPPMSAAEQFDVGFHYPRQIWDIRYPVVDEEYGVVMSFARFGLKPDTQPQRDAQEAERLVAEFFAIKRGMIWDIQAVMVNRDGDLPSGWAPDHGPGRDGWPAITCDRACLKTHMDDYYAALLANDAAGLPQAANARITVNGDVATLADTLWTGAQTVRWRFDIANPRLGDTAGQVVVTNADGSETMQIVRLKVADNAITEMEVIRANKGDAGDAWWGPEQLDAEPSYFLTLPIPEPERESYYKLAALSDGYFRAFQTNGTPDYHRPAVMPDTRRFENGAQFTANYRDGVYITVMDGFDRGRFVGRNLWDRRHAVIDEERGIVFTVLRFGATEGVENAASVASIDRLVGEFFTVKAGKLQEIQAVMINRDDDLPTGWDTEWYGPGKGGWGALPTGQ